eukprot:6193709-Pleurochrysis_carterae.AAC.4
MCTSELLKNGGLQLCSVLESVKENAHKRARAHARTRASAHSRTTTHAYSSTRAAVRCSTRARASCGCTLALHERRSASGKLRIDAEVRKTAIGISSSLAIQTTYDSHVQTRAPTLRLVGA